MDARRRELESWIANTQHNQKIFGVALVPLGLLAFALGPFYLLGVLLIAVTGFWVMHAHNETHQNKLVELERLARPPEGPQTGGHRRWQTH